MPRRKYNDLLWWDRKSVTREQLEKLRLATSGAFCVPSARLSPSNSTIIPIDAVSAKRTEHRRCDLMTKPDHRSSQASVYRHLYKKPEWQRTRAEQLRTHPLCQCCAKRSRVRAATICHHNDPKSKLSSATFFKGPFTSLCKTCHDSDAQGIEVRGFSTEIGEDGWPVDGAHPVNAP